MQYICRWPAKLRAEEGGTQRSCWHELEVHHAQADAGHAACSLRLYSGDSVAMRLTVPPRCSAATSRLACSAALAMPPKFVRRHERPPRREYSNEEYLERLEAARIPMEPPTPTPIMTWSSLGDDPTYPIFSYADPNLERPTQEFSVQNFLSPTASVDEDRTVPSVEPQVLRSFCRVGIHDSCTRSGGESASRRDGVG